MRGYISTLEEFKNQSTESILSILKSQVLNDNLDKDNSKQEQAWIRLIDDVKGSSVINKMPENIVIAVEYFLPTDGMGIDLILAGLNNAGEKTAFIIESKQWSDENVLRMKFSSFREDTTILHPQIQISKHKLSFSDYLDIGPEYIVRPFVFMRNCTDIGIKYIQDNNPVKNANVPIFNNIDVLLSEISVTLQNGDIGIAAELKNAAYEPSKGIIKAMNSIVTGEEAFILSTVQENVFKEVLKFLDEGKKIIRIKGNAGSGKTAVLLNLYLYYLKAYHCKSGKSEIKPIFVSGAQNTALYRSLYPEIAASFTYSYSLEKMIGNDARYYIFMDEAQHNQEGIITKAIEKGASVVLCYDERQIISASNPESEFLNLKQRYDFKECSLSCSMRYNGSQIAQTNIESYLKGKNTIISDSKYDFRSFNDFDSFQNAVLQKMTDCPSETVAVIGLMSNDADDYTAQRNRSSRLFKNWGYKGEEKWMPYIESRNYLSQKNGNIWVGTWWMPGLDVDNIAVIVGGDVIRTENGLECDLSQTKQYSMIVSVAKSMGLPNNLYFTKRNFGKEVFDNYRSATAIVQYIKQPGNEEIYSEFSKTMSKLIENMYYIMATRGRKGCYIYFTKNKV